MFRRSKFFSNDGEETTTPVSFSLSTAIPRFASSPYFFPLTTGRRPCSPPAVPPWAPPPTPHAAPRSRLLPASSKPGAPETGPHLGPACPLLPPSFSRSRAWTPPPRTAAGLPARSARAERAQRRLPTAHATCRLPIRPHRRSAFHRPHVIQICPHRIAPIFCDRISIARRVPPDPANRKAPVRHRRRLLRKHP